MEIKEIRLVKMIDENPTLDHLGEYTDDLEDWYIVCQYGEYYHDLTDEQKENMREPRGEYRCFKPVAGDEKPGTEDYKKYGLQDYAEMKRYVKGDVCDYIISAEVVFYVDEGNGNRRTMTLKSCGVGGVSSDSDGSDVQEIFEDELESLINNIKAIQFTETDYETMRKTPVKKVTK